MGWSSDNAYLPTEDEWKEKNLLFQNWLEQYMWPYRIQYRLMLMSKLLDKHYSEIKRMDPEQDPEILDKKVITWVIKVLRMYRLLVQHLSPRQQEEYAKPLHDYFELCRSEYAESGMPELHKALNQVFEACLTVANSDQDELQLL